MSDKGSCEQSQSEGIHDEEDGLQSLQELFAGHEKNGQNDHYDSQHNHCDFVVDEVPVGSGVHSHDG